MNFAGSDLGVLARYRDEVVAETDRWRGSFRLVGSEVFEELKAVAPRVMDKKAASAGDGGILGDLDIAGEESLAEIVEAGDGEGGMGFASGMEIRLHADVELLRAAFEPAAATRLERCRLWNFAQAQESPVEFASGRFAPRGSGYLKVIEMRDLTFHS